MPTHASSRFGYRAAAPLAKRKTADHERVEQLVAKMERSVRRAFLQFVANVQSPQTMREVAELLGRNDIEGALRVVDRYVVRMAPVVSTVFQDAAVDETAALAQQVRRFAPSAGISFDPTNERAARLMRDAQLQFIAEIGESQRNAVRQAITQALMEGAGPRDTARAFRDSIGLTSNMDQTVRNYRRLLEMGSREALDRETRDRRFDRTVARAADGGEPLSPQQIATMTERYRQRYVMYRSEVIARTETTRVVGQARQEALAQTLEDTGIDASLVERVWRSTRDDRTRDTHRAMDGETVGMNTPFTSPSGATLRFPGDPLAPAAETISCRCVVINRIKKPERNAT